MQEVSPQAIGSQDLCRAWVKSCFASLGGRSSRTLLIWTPLYSHILDLKLQEAIVLSFSFKLSNLTSWPPTKSLPLIVSNYIVLSYCSPHPLPIFFLCTTFTSSLHFFKYYCFLIPLRINIRTICLF